MEQIRFDNYNFTYSTGTKKALDNISLSIDEGEFVVILGHSGCGKSTLLRQIKSDIAPYGDKDGKLFFENREIDELDAREKSSKIGFVMQDPDSQIVTDKVWHELAFGLESLGMDSETIRLRVAEMASYFGIAQWFYRDVSELSGGQKQLLNLASIMAMHPSVLILDEPTSQLDPIAASDFLGTVKKINKDLGITVIMTEHRLEEVFPVADRAVVMENGQICFEGTPTEIAIELFEKKQDMLCAMPSATQIALTACDASYDDEIAVRAGGNNYKTMLPMTSGEGRKWLDKLLAKDESAVRKDKEADESNIKSDKKDAHKNATPIIRVEDLWFRYEKESPDVVKGLSMNIYPGEIYGLLGGNGTGKSTALSLISRVRKPYRGKITLAGKNIKKYSDKELYKGFLGVVPQNPLSLFVKNSVELELFEMIGKKTESNTKEVENIARLTHIESLLDRHPYDLSGGEQQRLAIAKILLLKPKILLLDEPTKGLDAAFKIEFADVLNKLQVTGVTILMISHDIEFCAKYCDRCGLFFDGNIVTENETKEFFAGNSFYTTSANKIARKYWPYAITLKDVIEKLETINGQ